MIRLATLNIKVKPNSAVVSVRTSGVLVATIPLLRTSCTSILSVIAHAPKLKVIANMAVGFDNIDVQLVRSKGIVATNTPEVLTETTAELGA